MRKNLLISTIGKDLDIFNSLKKVVEEKNICRSIYLVSDDKNSQETYERIKNFNKSYKIKTEKIDVFLPDQLELILKTLSKSSLKEKVKQTVNEQGQVYVDFTYGTKAMAAATFYYFVTEELIDSALYVTGTRDDKGKVIGNFQIIELPVKRLLLRRYYSQFINKLRNFDFFLAKDILNIFLSECTEKVKVLRNFIDYYCQFLRGDFRELTENFIVKIVDNFPSLNKDGLIYNTQIIANYKNIKRKKDIKSLTDSRQVLLFEFMYFYDLVKIHLQKEDYPVALALFASFLDKFLTIMMIDQKIEDSSLIFNFSFNNYFYKDKKIGDKLVPTGVGYKLNLFLKKDNNFYSFFQELIDKRNKSLFGHGFYFPNKNDGEKINKALENIVKKVNIKPKYNGFFFYYPLDMDFSITP